MSRNYTTTEKRITYWKGWYYSYASSPRPMTPIYNLDQRELKPKRGSCSRTESASTRVSDGTHTCSQTLNAQEPTGPVAYEPTNRTECSQSFRGPSGTNAAWPVPVFVLRTLRSRTASTWAARACMDKQWFRQDPSNETSANIRRTLACNGH